MKVALAPTKALQCRAKGNDCLLLLLKKGVKPHLGLGCTRRGSGKPTEPPCFAMAPNTIYTPRQP